MSSACIIAATALACAAAVAAGDGPSLRLFFTSAGRTGVIHADGTGQRQLELHAPGQATWQPAGTLADGRILLLSMEPRRDGPGRPFAEFYTRTPTHLWAHDPESGALTELCTRDRPAAFVTPALVLDDDRLLVQVVRDGVSQILSVRLDGSDAREFTRTGEGVPYGLSLSPDRRRVAFHLAGPEGYQVWTSDVDGGDRRLVAGHADHLYFGTSWSPDGRWVLYVDCVHAKDPGHDWCDVCIGRADGTQHTVLTSGQAMWFAATYGDRSTPGGGSNVPAWTRDGHILFPRRSPGARVPWRYRVGHPDTDHFNRDYEPESAMGGTQIVRLDPRDGSITPLTPETPGIWDFRASESADGSTIAFCRAATGAAPSIWVMGSDGSGARRISDGFDGRGADHPIWVAGPRAKK